LILFTSPCELHSFLFILMSVHCVLPTCPSSFLFSPWYLLSL
jgi:hypothetical protein